MMELKANARPGAIPSNADPLGRRADRPVFSRLNDLECQIERLSGAVHALEDRLTPIMVPHGGALARPGGAPPAPETCELESRLNASARLIETLGDLLNTALDRLAV